ncbi:hypothetical protein H5T88_07605 [bacterium]|nr:hypothetical protein [bacterium]
MKKWIASGFSKCEEEIATTYISFWFTILLLRSLAFFFPRTEQAPIYRSSTFHFLLVFSFFLISLLVRKRPALPFLFLGKGLGMIADEMGMMPMFAKTG